MEPPTPCGKTLRYIYADSCRDVMVLSGDQLYRMDFAQMVQTHRRTNADVTLAVLPVTRAQANRLGILHVDDNGRIVRLARSRRPMRNFEQLAHQRNRVGPLQHRRQRP